MAATRRTAAIALVAIALAACTDAAGLPESPADVPTETVLAGAATPTAQGPVSQTAAGDLAAAQSPGADPADTAPTEAADPDQPLPATVEVRQPDFVVDAGAELDDAVLGEVDNLPGLEHVARVARAEVDLSGPDGDLAETIMVVDPADFRPLTPESTAQAVGVWERLAAGDIVLRHDIANQLGVELGGPVLIATDEGSRVARVGAFAANGTPPVAAALVPWSVGRELGLERPNGLVLAVDDANIDSAPGALTDLLAGATVERRQPPEQRTATAGGSDRLEPFTYTDFGDGTIAIDPAWVSRYIRTVEIPGIATTRCHELMIPQLLAALDEIQALGLYDHFKPEQFGGCWVPRRIDWAPDMPLSNHAWGIAIDFNTHDNWLGDQPTMDRSIVEVFEKWGFEWGGHWSRPDGMHFELDRIVRPAGG